MALEMQEQWLPALSAEVEARRAGKELPTVDNTVSVDPAAVIQSERRQSTLLASGWYMHGSSLSLRYRPNGHADPLLKTLLDISARGVTNETERTRTQSTLRSLFDQLSSPFAAGRCAKCHSVDQGTTASVNWLPYQPTLDQHKFTRFSHAPHVTLLSDAACAKCHPFIKTQSAATSLFRTEFIDRRWRPATNLYNFESDFVAMSRSGCADCHSDDSGRDRCLTCHNYHVH